MREQVFNLLFFCGSWKQEHIALSTEKLNLILFMLFPGAHLRKVPMPFQQAQMYHVLGNLQS
jgi:hypothetical protein